MLEREEEEKKNKGFFKKLSTPLFSFPLGFVCIVKASARGGEPHEPLAWYGWSFYLLTCPSLSPPSPDFQWCMHFAEADLFYLYSPTKIPRLTCLSLLSDLLVFVCNASYARAKAFGGRYLEKGKG